MISEYLPITVIVTLVLFCTREVLDLSKRFREKKRLLSTFKLLLSEELRDNFYALNSLYEVLSRVDSALELNEKEIPIYKSITSDRCGNDKVDIQLGENSEYGLLHMPFPKFSTKRYENYLKEIALLDVELYQKITELYKALRYCEKIRSEVGEYLEQEEDYGFWSFSVRIKNMFDKKDEYNSSMQQLHILLTGKGMEIKRSEVIEIKI